MRFILLFLFLFFTSCDLFDKDKTSKKIRVIKNEQYKPACPPISFSGELIVEVKCSSGQPVCGTPEGEQTDPKVYCIDKEGVTLKDISPGCMKLGALTPIQLQQPLQYLFPFCELLK